MPDPRILNRLLFTFLTAMLIVSCSKSSEMPAVSETGKALLQYVPADSPYVIANLEPLPQDVLDIMEPKFDTILTAYVAIIRAAIDSENAKSEGQNGEDSEADGDLETANAVFEEIEGLMSLEGIRGAGIGRESTMVLYGDGLLPVLRMTLTDGKLMEQTISGIEEKAGEKMSVATIEGQSYRHAGDEESKIVIALVADDLVISLVPAGHSDELLKSVLGLSKPAESMADSGELQALAVENGFNSYFLLLLDVTRVASIFLDDPTSANGELLALMGHDATALSDVCKAEIRDMAGIVPRLIAGYTKITTEESESNFIIEVREDLAKGLATLVAPVQGLGTTEGGLFSFGMSLDVLAGREFYSARLDAMETDPYECEKFADLQAGVAKGRQALNQPLPPMVNSVKGFLLEVDSVEGLDIASKQPPTAIDASMLLAMENPQGLLAMGAMFSPELAALNLQADGKPVKIDLPPVSPALSNAYVAMTDSALAISLGAEAEDKLGDLLGAAFADPTPFMSMNMDAGKYYGFISDMMGSVQPDNDQATPELNAAMADLMNAMEGWFGRMSVDVNFTERGVEMLSTVEMAEPE